MRFCWPAPPLRLGTRIAVVTLAAFLVIQAFNSALFLLIPPPRPPFYSSGWLIAKVEQAALEVFSAGDGRRVALCVQLEAKTRLHLRWQRTEPAAPELPGHIPPFLERVRSAIENNLKGKVKKVAVRGWPGPPGPGFHGHRHAPPPEFPGQPRAIPIGASEPDSLVPGIFEIAIQGPDGSWVIIEPEKMPFYATFLHPWFITALAAAVLISILSAYTAKRSLRPLDRLVGAAQAFGSTRKATPIDTGGLGEFRVIAQAMNEMQERIKRFLDERTEMLAAISHDLGTALTRMLLNVEGLAEDESKMKLIANVEEMEKMLSATLTFVRGDLKSEPAQLIDLAVQLISLCDMFSDRNRPAEYSGPDHLLAVCQPVATKRAFANLIDNAIKYGTCARVSLSRSGDRASIVYCGRRSWDSPGQSRTCISAVPALGQLAQPENRRHWFRACDCARHYSNARRGNYPLPTSTWDGV